MKLEEALRILCFENTSDLPKLKDIQKHFHRLSKIKHPDKNNGSKESTKEFQTLLDAYHTAGKAAEKVVPSSQENFSASFNSVLSKSTLNQSQLKLKSNSTTFGQKFSLQT